MIMEQKNLKTMIKEAKRIVFFGGAGVSTGSGIPDFRGSGGLYTEANETEESPEEILSGEYLRKYPEKFYRYYKKNMLYPNAKPNGAHRALARLEQMGKLTAVITQNIDGLHEAAGSRNVIAVHGSVLSNYCTSCYKEYPLSYILEAESVPLCEHCGKPVRPDVVLYGEGLDGLAFSRAQREIEHADLLIVGGTSLTVYPAAGLLHSFRGSNLVIINRTPTPYDPYAALIIREPIEDVLSAAIENL